MGCIALLMSLLCDVRIHRKAGAVGIEFPNRIQVQHRLMDLFARGNQMFHTFGITEAQANESANTAVTDIFCSTDG